jgi:hypothetical protein
MTSWLAAFTPEHLSNRLDRRYGGLVLKCQIGFETCPPGGR